MIAPVLQQAYDIFASYKTTLPLDVCTECCMKPEGAAKLAGMKVREIPADLLMTYNDGAKPEKTGVDEIKHFLPRYLELISNYEFPTRSTELALTRLYPFDRNQWPEEEYRLLTEFRDAFFRQSLSLYPLPSFNDRMDTLLIMFHKAGLPVEPLLKILEQEEHPGAVLHFRELYFDGLEMHNKSKLCSAFAEDEINDVIVDWVNIKDTKKAFAYKIEKYMLDAAADDVYVNDLNLLYEIIRADL